MLKPTHYKFGLPTMLVQKLKARENDPRTRLNNDQLHEAGFITNVSQLYDFQTQPSRGFFSSYMANE